MAGAITGPSFVQAQFGRGKIGFEREIAERSTVQWEPLLWSGSSLQYP
jgi:hypothetical protein